MDDSQLLRYSRHILLDEIGIEGQQKLLAARALVIGAGGLGSPAAMYLASAGVGKLTLVDNDTVDLTNLQRQIAHNMARVGLPKAESARDTLAAINPTIEIVALVERADDARLAELVSQADVVLDCTDNFATRHAVNRACVAHEVPLVSGAVIRFDGQVSVFDTRGGAHRSADLPCYSCLFPQDQPFEDVACSTMGVFAPLVGVVGATQAAEALKLLMGVGEPLSGRLLLLDGLRMEWTSIRIARNDACPVCAAPAPDSARQRD
ncbi:HesA/MoeB/ThiF family protein [Pseudoduganella sp. LjRoot289]|uniref:HesA/MoeB/ThiF family protein n=1 Tax=Pseudoduganella sp. LjRoot289 TaxID=3342314 RepID=UPI003ED123EA